MAQTHGDLPSNLVLLNSITDAGPAAGGKIGISGSHGGLFAAWVASHAKLRAVVLNDAGRGLEDAGIAGVKALDSVSMAGVAEASTTGNCSKCPRITATSRA